MAEQIAQVQGILLQEGHQVEVQNAALGINLLMDASMYQCATCRSGRRASSS
jgi:hypothetical protein